MLTRTDTLRAFAVAIAQTGQHLNGLEVGSALVTGHLVVDAVGLAGGEGLVEVLAGEGSVGDGGFRGRWHGGVGSEGAGAHAGTRASALGLGLALREGGGGNGAGLLLPMGILAVGLLLLLALKLGNALHEALILDLVLEEGVEQGGVLGGVGAGHHEEAAAIEGVGRGEGARVVAQMGVAVGFEDGPGVIALTEAVEEAQGVAAGDALVELLDKDAAVVRVDELANEARDELVRVPTRQRLARGRGIQEAAVRGEDVQEVAQLLEHALRPVAALGELGEGAARGILVGRAEAGGQRAGTSACWALVERVGVVGLLVLLVLLLVGVGRGSEGVLRGRFVVVELRQVHVDGHHVLERHVHVGLVIRVKLRHGRKACHLRFHQPSSRCIACRAPAQTRIGPWGATARRSDARTTSTYFSGERTAILVHGGQVW